MAANWFESELKNNNYLSPIGFKFILEKAPKVAFLCQTANIPNISLGTPEIPTYLVNIPIDGNLRYGEFSITFLIDENLENWLEIHNWMRALGVPTDFAERREFESKVNFPGNSKDRNIFSDGTLQILTNNFNYNFTVQFIDLIPISLSEISFDATQSDGTYATATATFNYTYYEIRNDRGERITVSSWNPSGI